MAPRKEETSTGRPHFVQVASTLQPRTLVLSLAKLIRATSRKGNLQKTKLQTQKRVVFPGLNQNPETGIKRKPWSFHKDSTPQYLPLPVLSLAAPERGFQISGDADLEYISLLVTSELSETQGERRRGLPCLPFVVVIVFRVVHLGFFENQRKNRRLDRQTENCLEPDYQQLKE